jgi:Protein of unknown function (DUF2012)
MAISLLLSASLVLAMNISGSTDLSSIPDDQRSNVLLDATVEVQDLITGRLISDAIVGKDGNFELNLPDSTFPSNLLLRCTSSYYVFPKFDLKIEGSAVKLSQFDPFNVTKLLDPTNLIVKPIKPIEYTPPKEPFDFLSLLKNPMILFGGGAILLMSFLGRLQSTLGEEADQGAVEAKLVAEYVMKDFRNSI